MNIINFYDSRPIYEQIVEYYKRLILVGAMEADEQMPSVRSLAMELSTNPNTVQKAYTRLEQEGFLYSVKGRGNFVKENGRLLQERQKEICDKIGDLLKEAREMGLDTDAVIRQASERMDK